MGKGGVKKSGKTGDIIYEGPQEQYKCTSLVEKIGSILNSFSNTAKKSTDQDLLFFVCKYLV
jgi:hypothetical protein